jgi:hypothetical protein
MEWLIDFDYRAVFDLENLKSRRERRAVHIALEKLGTLGPELTSPHVKSLRGEPDLFELRPRRGASPVRLIYARKRDRFVILAAAANKPGFDRAVKDARRRLKHRI